MSESIVLNSDGAVATLYRLNSLFPDVQRALQPALAEFEVTTIA